MRDFSETPSYSFQDFPKTFNAYNPAYDETYRTRDSEANSSSFFHWNSNAGSLTCDWSRPSPYTLNHNERSFMPSCPVATCAAPATVSVTTDQMNVMPDLAYSQVDSCNTFGLFRSFDQLPSGDSSVVRLKEEPGAMGSQQLSTADKTFPSFPSFPSFQEGSLQQMQQTDTTQELFMQLIGKSSDNMEAVGQGAQSSASNLEKIIDECMSLDNRDDVSDELGNFDTDFANWALGLCDTRPYPQDVRSCRWLDCPFTCDNQDDLVSGSRDPVCPWTCPPKCLANVTSNCRCR